MMFAAQTIVSNVLIASLIGGLAWSVGRSGRRAGLAHLLWVAFLIKLITPPLLQLPILPSQAGPAMDMDWWIGLGVLWLAGFAFFVARGLVRSIRFHLLIKREGTSDPEATAFVASLLADSRRASAHEAVRLPLRLSPMLFGFALRPVIVCPESLWAILSDPERHAFLAHETAHYHRHDHWVRWLEWLVGCIYWWFPGVHFAHRQLERHEEACCDAWAVARLNSTPRQYAEALLRVVDFISEHSIGMPRLANGMRPTDSLEERIRLLMCARGLEHATAPLNMAVGIGCVALMLVHPAERRIRTFRVDSLATHQLGADTLEPSIASSASGSQSLMIVPEPLPGTLRGFWNQPPPRRWANIPLSLPGAHLVADVDHGIRVDGGRYPTISFSNSDVSAIAEIPSTQRVVIGTAAGNLRLWDLTAGMPVSLIGKHASGVTSVAYHPTHGLVSGDSSGTVNRWDLQSGQILASWSGSDSGVQSIRYAADGKTMMILSGGWRHCGTEQTARLVDSRSLALIQSWPVHGPAAVVLERPECGWVAVDWSGHVRRLETETLAAMLSKDDVSSLVLSQDTHPNAKVLP